MRNSNCTHLLLLMLLLFSDLVDCITEVGWGDIECRGGVVTGEENTFCWLRWHFGGHTSVSVPLTISTNCLHFNINNRFLLCCNKPGYIFDVVSIASPILPLSTNFNIPVNKKKKKTKN